MLRLGFCLKLDHDDLKGTRHRRAPAEEAYPLDDLKSLYQLRWGVEESYKQLKKILHVEYFSGKTPQAIKQDFYAKVFMLNMASMVRTQGVGVDDQRSNSKYKYKPSKVQTLAKVKDFLTDIFFGKRLRNIVTQLTALIKRRMDAVRPGRSFPRLSTDIRRRHKITNAKGI